MTNTRSDNKSDVIYAVSDNSRPRARAFRGLTRRDISPRTVARFHAKYERKEGQCWLWTGATFRQGYGMFNLGRHHDGRQHTEFAHRVAYVLATGSDIPAGLPRYVVMHACDTPACVNPAHLSLGTQRDNLRDAVAKGRWRGGPPRRLCLTCGSRPAPISSRSAVCAVCREAERAIKRELSLARTSAATRQVRLRAEERAVWREGRAS